VTKRKSAKRKPAKPKASKPTKPKVTPKGARAKVQRPSRGAAARKGAPRIHSGVRRPSRGAAARGQIAIDGPAGAGKSTAARLLAAALGYIYVDTGAMYRAVGLAAKRRGIDPDDQDAVAPLVAGVTLSVDAHGTRVHLDGRDVTAELRTPDAAAWSSRIAAHALVRTRLLARQRALAEKGGVIMDGRDIGTVVLPNADYKFFLTASTDERARRRHAEDLGGGTPIDLAATRAEIAARDERDRARAVAPLVPAADAFVIDTSTMNAEAVVARMLQTVRERARP
jgi:CMP/dCMP kinase